MRQPHPAPTDAGDPSAPPDHRVELYADVDALAASVGRFLHPALAGAGTAVLIGAAARRSAFTTALADAGVDVGAALGSGRLVLLDAQATLDRLLVGDELDTSSFHDVMGGAVDRAAGAGGPVRIYGEVVALLWEQGRVPAAMALEQRWNDLIAAQPVSMLCAYPAALFASDDAGRDLEAMCGQHTEVTGVPDAAVLPAAVRDRGGRTARWQLPAALTSGALARARVREVLLAWQLPHLLDETELLVTELVNNAVVHAGSEVAVSVSHREALHVEVSDAGRGVPQRVDGDLHDTSGRGLLLVAAMSSAWGSDTRGGGKTVWFELATG